MKRWMLVLIAALMLGGASAGGYAAINHSQSKHGGLAIRIQGASPTVGQIGSALTRQLAANGVKTADQATPAILKKVSGSVGAKFKVKVTCTATYTYPPGTVTITCTISF